MSPNSPASTTTASVYVRETCIPSFTPTPPSRGVQRRQRCEQATESLARLVAAQILSPLCFRSAPHRISTVSPLFSAPP